MHNKLKFTIIFGRKIKKKCTNISGFCYKACWNIYGPQYKTSMTRDEIGYKIHLIMKQNGYNRTPKAIIHRIFNKGVHGLNLASD